MSQNYALPQGSLILVTGANGYIASHVIDILLDLGYNVRGTVRSPKPWLDKLFEETYGKGRFESVIAARFEQDGVFDKAVKGVDGVVHVASDISMRPNPNAVIPTVIAGTVNAPSAAAKTSSVKRFVLTSSSTAVLVPEPNKHLVVSEEWFVGVRDTARSHIIALLSPTVTDRRLFAFAAPQNWTDVVTILRKLRPNNTTIPDPPENEGRDLTDVSGPLKWAEQLLKDFFGRDGWISLEESIADIE